MLLPQPDKVLQLIELPLAGLQGLLCTECLSCCIPVVLQAALCDDQVTQRYGTWLCPGYHWQSQCQRQQYHRQQGSLSCSSMNLLWALQPMRWQQQLLMLLLRHQLVVPVHQALQYSGSSRDCHGLSWHLQTAVVLLVLMPSGG
jgi:hypothetical protein